MTTPTTESLSINHRQSIPECGAPPDGEMPKHFGGGWHAHGAPRPGGDRGDLSTGSDSSRRNEGGDAAARTRIPSCATSRSESTPLCVSAARMSVMSLSRAARCPARNFERVWYVHSVSIIRGECVGRPTTPLSPKPRGASAWRRSVRDCAGPSATSRTSAARAAGPSSSTYPLRASLWEVRPSRRDVASTPADATRARRRPPSAGLRTSRRRWHTGRSA